MGSIPRKAIAVAGVIVVPFVGLISLYAPNGVVSIAAFLWGGFGVLLAGVLAWNLSRRIKELTAFSDRVPDLTVPRPRLRVTDDELGQLARSLSRMVPQIEEGLKGLSIELARREAILASVPEAVLAVDARLNVSFCNDLFVRTVQGQGITEGVPLVKILRDPKLLELLKRVIASGETIRQQLKMPVSEHRSFEVYATPLANASSAGALAILRDISPIERLERTRRDFVANVSHEFRTPLATITGYTETLLNGGLEDQQNRRKFVEIIQANSVRLNNIAADLLTLSELEGGRPGLEPQPIAVGDVIQSAIGAMEPIARMQGVRVWAEPVADFQVLGHRIRFEQALLNLLDNAIKFNGRSGEVKVKVEGVPGDQVEISVADTGIGIPPEDLSRVFERFYRVDKARSRQVGGTGLGLSIVKHAIEQMHGAVRVSSQLGTGTCFTITLPRYDRS